MMTRLCLGGKGNPGLKTRSCLRTEIAILGQKSLNELPGVVLEVPDVELIAGGDPHEVSLPSLFNDPEDDMLTYSASIADTMVASVAIADTQLVVTPLAVGETIATVTASDGRGEVSTSFIISIPTGVNVADEALLPTEYALVNIKTTLTPSIDQLGLRMRFPIKRL